MAAERTASRWLTPVPHLGRREPSASFPSCDPPQLEIRLQADRVILPTNLRMLPRSLSMPPAYLRTIEATVPLLLVSLQIERADCR